MYPFGYKAYVRYEVVKSDGFLRWLIRLRDKRAKSKIIVRENYTPWDGAEFLTDDEVIVEYLKAALEEDDPAFFMKAIGNVARAKGMTTIHYRP